MPTARRISLTIGIRAHFGEPSSVRQQGISSHLCVSLHPACAVTYARALMCMPLCG
jgi:hypothetical protein